jgi:kynurenine formamidase
MTMRDVPQPRLRPWEPPAYRVDADGKVEGATPGTPNNWGRWGDDDQRGTANLFTPERVAAAAGLVRSGKRFSLALPIGGLATPSHRPPPLHLFHHTTADRILGDRGMGGLQTSDDYVVMALQGSTQLDGFGHVGAGDTLYNGYWAGLVSARSGARRLGVHHQAIGIAGRGVLLDVARRQGVDRLAPDVAIGPEMLEATASAQGVEVKAGDVLLVRTGQLGWWLDLPDKGEAGIGEPGLSPRTVPWLAEHDVAMVATDTTAVEIIPFEEGQPALGLHIGALRDLGLLLGELFDLDDLAGDCAADGVYECFLVATPMPVVGGVGSPLNPLALK